MVDDQKFGEVAPQMKLDLKAGKHVLTVLVPKASGGHHPARGAPGRAAKVVTAWRPGPSTDLP